MLRRTGEYLVATSSRTGAEPWLSQIMRLLRGQKIARATKADSCIDAALGELDRAAVAAGAGLSELKVAVSFDERQRGRSTAVATARLVDGPGPSSRAGP